MDLERDSFLPSDTKMENGQYLIEVGEKKLIKERESNLMVTIPFI